ncbi:hypothetical protein O7598_23725 [Micromonospora sp. WMMC241]|uniref:hypothetical protein n=1 Tax=Micromonospora sp. WMMC241 TaxID=3015159 RepID=UPI0022B614E6|nr:hypothetical protein [Micromonospora sp. WMMC241]MCZ7439433.1 hypothetical protein [Micromonospora sp. WMMC241]
MATGVTRRLGRLRRNGYYCIAALDHGLSLGETQGIATLSQLSSRSVALHAAGFPAVVLNAGVLRHTSLPPELSVVAQLVGMPMHSVNALDRVPLAMPAMAVSAGADAVSIQLKADAMYGTGIIERLTLLSHEAHALGLPVLLMLTGDKWESARQFMGAVRSLSEIGVDLIKAAPGSYLDELPKGALVGLSVPLLYPGGELSVDYRERVVRAATAGYAGVCIGRNLFQSTVPFRDQIAMLDSIFGRKHALTVRS